VLGKTYIVLGKTYIDLLYPFTGVRYRASKKRQKTLPINTVKKKGDINSKIVVYGLVKREKNIREKRQNQILQKDIREEKPIKESLRLIFIIMINRIINYLILSDKTSISEF